VGVVRAQWKSAPRWLALPQVHTFSWLSTLLHASLAFPGRRRESGQAEKGGESGGEWGNAGEAYATNNLILCCIQKGATGKRGGETTTEMPLYGLFDGKVDVKL